MSLIGPGLGEGTCRKPVLKADRSDPDLLRVGDAGHPRPAPGRTARLRIGIGAGARCRFSADAGDGQGRQPSGSRVFAATLWRWVGALLGLFAVAPTGAGHAGAAAFTQFRITADSP